MAASSRRPAGGRTAIDEFMLNDPAIQHTGRLPAGRRAAIVYRRHPDVLVLAGRRRNLFVGATRRTEPWPGTTTSPSTASQPCRTARAHTAATTCSSSSERSPDGEQPPVQVVVTESG